MIAATVGFGQVAVDEGVTNMRELVKETACSSSCGRCVPFARQVLDKALEQSQAGLTFVQATA